MVDRLTDKCVCMLEIKKIYIINEMIYINYQNEYC